MEKWVQANQVELFEKKVSNRWLFKGVFENEQYEVNLGEKKTLLKAQEQKVFSIFKLKFEEKTNRAGQPYIKKTMDDAMIQPAYYAALFTEGQTVPQNCSHYGLALEKFGRFVGNKLDYISGKGQDTLFHPWDKNDNYWKKDGNIRELQNKSQQALAQAAKGKWENWGIILRQNWRMALHLGAASAYNNGFLIHKIYGVPYLPGRSIKGILRQYVIRTYFNESEEEALRDNRFYALFGKPSEEITNEGFHRPLIFWDSFPSNTDFEIRADIMNPHNTDYYKPNNTKHYPTDTQNPKPIKFLTLTGASFDIQVGIPNHLKEEPIAFNDTTWDSPGSFLQESLEKALWLFGVGAKTNLGYGRLMGNSEALGNREAETNKKKQLEAIRSQEAVQMELAQKEGLAPFIEACNDFGHLGTYISVYKKRRKIDEHSPLPQQDHPAVLAALDRIYGGYKGKKKQLFRSNPTKHKTIAIWIGEEPMKQWFNKLV